MSSSSLILFSAMSDLPSIPSSVCVISNIVVFNFRSVITLLCSLSLHNLFSFSSTFTNMWNPYSHCVDVLVYYFSHLSHLCLFLLLDCFFSSSWVIFPLTCRSGNFQLRDIVNFSLFRWILLYSYKNSSALFWIQLSYLNTSSEAFFKALFVRTRAGFSLGLTFP